MADVFISYRHVRPDQDLAAELKNYLNENRVSHFIDTGLRIGQNWIEVIDRELRACQSLVVLLSSESIRSDMVRHEVKLAHQWNKRIFPVRVDYDGALPYDLGAYLDSIQYKLWRSSEPFAPICGAILDGVREGPEQARDGIEPSSEALRRLGEVTELRGAPLPSADPRLETGGLKPGDRVRVYYQDGGSRGLLQESEDGEAEADARDYDVKRYVRQLQKNLAPRLACAFTPADYSSTFADPEEMPLFAEPRS